MTAESFSQVAAGYQSAAISTRSWIATWQAREKVEAAQTQPCPERLHRCRGAIEALEQVATEFDSKAVRFWDMAERSRP